VPTSYESSTRLGLCFSTNGSASRRCGMQSGGEIVGSGFPGIRNMSGRAQRLRLDGYVERVIDHDFQDELGATVRRPDTLRRWMAAYAAATATTTTLEKIRDAATSNQATPAKATGLAYRDALTRLFILDPIDGGSRRRAISSDSP
jgi:hypothetical protein